MSKLRVLLSVDSAAWAAIPAVARWLSLPSDAQTPEVASMVFEALVMDAYLESAAGHVTIETTGGVEQAVDAILDPNISKKDFVLQILVSTAQGTGLTLSEHFDEFALADPLDVWIKAVEAKTEDNVLWRIALASTYRVIKGDERRLPTTWALIARTYHLLHKSVDNGSKEGENSNSPSSETTLPKP